jgi:DNA-binding NtrC family response regulator
MKKPDQMNILLVDDENTLREIVAMQIEEEGYRVAQAASGNDAFEIIKSTDIDLVISDMRMPNGSGEDLLKMINTLDKKPIFIMITGFSELSKKEIMGLGAKDMLAKPIDFELLGAHIKEVLNSL